MPALLKRFDRRRDTRQDCRRGELGRLALLGGRGQTCLQLIGDLGDLQHRDDLAILTAPADIIIDPRVFDADPENLKVETISGELRPGFQILLCSDGLTEEVDDATIASLLAHSELSAQECVDHLVSAALDGGGSDNVTVLLLRRV